MTLELMGLVLTGVAKLVPRNLNFLISTRRPLLGPCCSSLHLVWISLCFIAMALALAQAGPLKPEIELAQALDDYERILSVQDRKKLHAEKAPDTMAVINFTTLIDRECDIRRHQYMGPRLITILESIQQFSGVADTFVSSHPEIAALVWGGVKLALKVVHHSLD